MRRRWTVLGLVLPLMASSCFTTLVWEADLERSHYDEHGFEIDEDSSNSWDELCFKLLLTPFTLVLDCVTMPLQEALGLDDLDIGDDDDC